MKLKKQLICSLVSILFLCSLTGCTDSHSPERENELHFSLEKISDITISYDEETITFYETEGDQLVVKEYMTEHKASYHAVVKQDENSIHISEGGKPLFKGGFLRYIEVYLPSSYSEALTVTTTNGTIDLSETNLHLSTLRIDSTAGTVKIDKAAASEISLSTTRGTLKLGKVTAAIIRLTSTSGNVTCDELNGNVIYTSTSGNIAIRSARGSGSYTASNSGRLDVVYTDVTGDLSFFNKNETITLTLPSDLEFEFEATTKNGSVSTTFQGDLRVDGRTTRGTVGKQPTVTIKMETKNGNIAVTQ